MKADILEKKRDSHKGAIVIEERQPLPPFAYIMATFVVVIILFLAPKPYHAFNEEITNQRNDDGQMLVKTPVCFGLSVEFGGNPYDSGMSVVEEDSRFFTHVCFGIPWKVKDYRNPTGF